MAKAFETMLDLSEGQTIRIQGDIPASAEELLERVACPWLKYAGFKYHCHELYYKKKKAVDLGTDTEGILISCTSCKDGQINQIQEQNRKMLRGQNIKSFLGMINLFDDFARRGIPGTVTFCNRLDPIGTAMNKITCSKHDVQVEIDKVCKNPPCEYLEQYPIRMETEFPQAIKKIMEGLAEDAELIEDLSPRKPVEAEQVDQDAPEET